MLVDKIITPDDIKAQARQWVGVKWRHQGRNKNGIDCVGLILVTAWGVGLKMPDTIAYSRYYIPQVMLDAFLSRDFKLIPKEEKQSGDVLLINIGRTPTHTAIYIFEENKESIIHAYAPSRKTKEESLYPILEKRISHVFRYPGVN